MREVLILIELYADHSGVMGRMGPDLEGSGKPERRAWNKEKAVTPGTEEG